MRFDQRIVTQTPLREIWNEHGVVSTNKLRDVTVEDIAQLLRGSKVQFVVADVGDLLEWISSADCYAFWKPEVKNHLADPASDNHLEHFADGYFYFASSGSHRPAIR